MNTCKVARDYFCHKFAVKKTTTFFCQSNTISESILLPGQIKYTSLMRQNKMLRITGGSWSMFLCWSAVSLYNSCSKIITQPFFNLFICSSYFLSSYLTLSLGWLCYHSCRYNFHMHVQRSMCTNMLPSGEPYSYRFSCLCIWMLVSVTYVVIIHGTTHTSTHTSLDERCPECNRMT